MPKPRCYAVDDEPLALASLVRLLQASGQVDVVGQATDPEVAIAEIPAIAPDVLFLDIHMPEIDGFQLLASLQRAPHVVFATAYDHYAVRAFEVNSLDYLLKPIDEDRLAATLNRLSDRLSSPAPELASLLTRLSGVLPTASYLQRVATRKGDHLVLIPVKDITHFVSEHRYTYGQTVQGRFLLDLSLVELESRLNPAQFLRIHRSTIVNLQCVDQMSRWFAGRVLVRLRDKSELPVSREKVAVLRQALGL
ncbi:MAG: LytR/AlgR family response regulator transcription factor [Myxococcaceae bacterium]